MNRKRDHAIDRLVRVLNGDVLLEFRMADACIRHASRLPREYYPVVRRQIAACAANALTNATALAAEIMALGGMPELPGRNPDQPPSATMQAGRFQAHAMLAHYRRRLRMAEQLGLLRLSDVFQRIIRTKERHLAHSEFLRAGEPASRRLYS